MSQKMEELEVEFNVDMGCSGYAAKFFRKLRRVAFYSGDELVVVDTEERKKLFVFSRDIVDIRFKKIKESTIRRSAKFREKYLLLGFMNGSVATFDMEGLKILHVFEVPIDPEYERMSSHHHRWSNGIQAITPTSQKFDMVHENLYEECYFLSDGYGRSTLRKLCSDKIFKEFSSQSMLTEPLAWNIISRKFSHCIYISVIDPPVERDNTLWDSQRAIWKFNYHLGKVELKFEKPQSKYSPRPFSMTSYIDHFVTNHSEIVVCYDFSSHLITFFDGDTGKVHFSFRENTDETGMIPSSTCFMDQYLFFGAQTGLIQVYDLRKIGKEILQKRKYSNAMLDIKDVQDVSLVLQEKICDGFVTDFQIMDWDKEEKVIRFLVSSYDTTLKVVNLKNIHIYEYTSMRRNSQQWKDLRERVEYLGMEMEENSEFLDLCIRVCVNGTVFQIFRSLMSCL